MYDSSNKQEKGQFDLMWQFLQLGGMKANYPALKEFCLQLRQLMMQKTAGQRKDARKDISFDDVWTIKNNIVCEAMALVLSGEMEPVIHAEKVLRDRHRGGYRNVTGYLFDDFGCLTHSVVTVRINESSQGLEPYCGKCGALLAESFQDYCPHCGAKMDGGSKE